MYTLQQFSNVSPRGKQIIGNMAAKQPIGPALITSNQDLSQKRAENVMEFLVSQGFHSDLVSAQGFGDSNPVASNDTAPGSAQNRRVELSVPAAGC